MNCLRHWTSGSSSRFCGSFRWGDGKRLEHAVNWPRKTHQTPHRHTFIYVLLNTYTLLWLSCFHCEFLWICVICVKFNCCMSSIFFIVRGLPRDSHVKNPSSWATKINLAQIRAVFSPWLKSIIHIIPVEYIQAEDVFVCQITQPQNKTQILPVISAGKHVRLQQCWWWWFVITDLRAGRLWSLATSMECFHFDGPERSLGVHRYL